MADQTISARFRKMADAIDHNAESSTFGGAAVIVPPASGGEPVELLVLDVAADPTNFWRMLMERAKAVVEQADRENARLASMRR